mmetsp:Transcript_28104/g.47287  ORF Transcript_28104/g.47287 Transcript_28104/m.47287 type:complete len:612 (+) Transcript_28104:86-1921(+)
MMNVQNHEEDRLLSPQQELKDGQGSSTCTSNSLTTGNYNTHSALLIFLYPALGGLLFGYDIGATSSVIIQLQSAEYSGVTWFNTIKDNSLLIGIITSSSLIGAMIGCLICFKVSDSLGRRGTILVAAVLYFFGSIIEFVSGIASWTANVSIPVLIVGRSVYGLACGFAMQGAPAYIGEMSPATIRGLLISMKESFIVLGTLLGYSIGYIYSTQPGGWRLTYGWASVVAIAMFAGMYYLPRSSQWLALKGRVHEAVSSLRFVTPNLTPPQIHAITDLATTAAAFQPTVSLYQDWKQLTAPGVYPALVVGIGLVVFQQTTGQPSVLYYADSIFEDVGVTTAASIAISLFKLLATLCTTFTVDRYGRKLLLYIGCSLMLVALLLLGTAFTFPYSSAEDCHAHDDREATCPSTCTWREDDSSTGGANGSGSCEPSSIDTQKILILSSLFAYIGGYQVGFGPIVWLVIAEVFPLEVRGKAVSLAVVTNFFCNALMTFIFPIELSTFGAAATFYIYAVVLLMAVYFVHRYLPETKGLTLQQIEQMLLLQSNRASSQATTSSKGSTGSTTAAGTCTVGIGVGIGTACCAGEEENNAMSAADVREMKVDPEQTKLITSV